MPPQLTLRAARRRAAAAALAVAAVPATAALAAPGAAALPMSLSDQRVAFGERVVAAGRLDADDAGRPVALEQRGRNGAWTALARGAIRPDGSYRLRVRPQRSGPVRVSLGAPDSARAAAATPAASAARGLSVSARVAWTARRLRVRAGRSVQVRGRALPARPGRPVALQVRRARRWITLDRSRTRRDGSFSLRRRIPGALSAPVRVGAAGGGGVERGRRRAGRLEAFRYAHASWYGPGLYGNPLGCGGRLWRGTLGVAHKSLPCGTPVTFRHRGRTLRVRVIDRGPYVAGREYDLTERTARALRFRGHGPIQTTR